ncbi:MAG: DUF1700 domain-containing protein [Clostridia bacterium]|nr:DUF1700 domain-containing protein [Clostridia bacterium]
MTKYEFLQRLREGLSGLPQSDVEERVAFYSEMIDDLVEDGVSEEAAVARVGPVERVVRQTVAETPFTKIVKERVRPRRQLRVWEILLIVFGSPIWLSLLIVAAALLLTVYITLWAFVISLWAVEISLIAGAAACAVAGVFFAVQDSFARGMALIGAGLVLAGLAIFGFFLCFLASKGAVLLTVKIAQWVKSLFVKGRSEQ